MKKGEQSAKHKYIERLLTGVKNGKNKYRYVYEKPKTKLTSKKKDLVNAGKEFIKSMAIGTVSVKALAVSGFVRAGKNITKQLAKTISNNNESEEKKVVNKEIRTKEKEKIVTNPQGAAKYKYIAKIKQPNGRYRYFYDEKSLNSYYLKHGTFAEKALARKAGLKKVNADEKEDSKEINEKYELGLEYQNNCYDCSIAFDLRRRGFNVEAIPDDDGGTEEDIRSCYTDLEEKDINRIYIYGHTTEEKILNEFVKGARSCGDGAYGNLCVHWKFFGGHSMAWFVRDDKVYIQDCQTNTTYGEDEMMEVFQYVTCNTDKKKESAFWFRADDKTLSPRVLMYSNKN